eukprot:117283-Rhodomonas_salina.1
MVFPNKPQGPIWGRENKPPPRGNFPAQGPGPLLNMQVQALQRLRSRTSQRNAFKLLKQNQK